MYRLCENCPKLETFLISIGNGVITLRNIFLFKPKTSPFHLFSGEHLVTIGIIIAVCILLFVFRNQLRHPQTKRVWCYSIAFLLFATYAFYHFGLVFQHTWTVKKDLPLQLSDLVVILAIVMLLSNNYKLFQFMYFTGVSSSIQAIITPDLGRYSFPHFRYIEFFVVHGGVVVACLLLVVACKYRPTIRALWVSVLIVNLYAACVLFIDKWLGSNYLYLMKKPSHASLLDYLGPWPWYILSMELVMIVSFYLLFLPFWIGRKIEQP